MSHPSLPLDQPLPAELLRRSSRGLASYQNYPVFSWNWLRRRSALFALATTSFGALSALGVGLSRASVDAALSVFVHFTLGVMTIATSGPLLATIVRHQKLRSKRERPLVMLALVLGIGISFAADAWSSGLIGQDMSGSQIERPKTSNPQGATLGLNILILATIYGLLGGGLAIRRYWDEPRELVRLAREREVSELRARNRELDARLGVLQAQIEPHFLFNTMASVRSLIASNPSTAVRTLDALVDYLRATIPRLREQDVESTLGQQIEICESYLKLMQARMGRLEYEVRVDPALRTMPFPPFLLIHLVENAVKHGVEPKPGPGHIAVSVHEQHDGLVASVSDDGLGLGHGLGTGVGLSNVRDQLRLRYGDRASFVLTGRTEGGAVATITIRDGVQEKKT